MGRGCEDRFEKMDYPEILKKLELTHKDDSYAGGFSTRICKETINNNSQYTYHKPMWTIESSLPADDNGEDIIKHPKIKEQFDEFFKIKENENKQNRKICVQTKEFLDFCFRKLSW